MAEVITAKTIKQNMIDNGYAEKSVLFRGDKKANVNAKDSSNMVKGSERSVVIKNQSWVDTEGYITLWNEVGEILKKMKANTATFDQTSYDQLVDKLRIDVTRRRFEYADLTSQINMVSDGFNDGKSVTLDEILPFGAVFLPDNFRGAAVNKIDQKYGATGTITHQGYSVGWSETLENKLYNLDLSTMQRVMIAVARGYVAKRNDLVAGEIVGATYQASQVVAADATGGTKEEKLYITLDSALETLLNLKDPQTGQIIRADQTSLLCYPGDVRRINRAINGVINIGGKGKVANRSPLTEITNILPYYGDSITVGKKTYTFTGVAKNYAYLFVPGVGITRQKRGLTQETSEGSALTLSQQELAWYFIQQNYMNEFFGSSDATVFAKTGAGFGYCVKISLPAA
jgi:hypothetical protein